MKIVKKWLFRISTGHVENLDISHDDDSTEVDEFVSDIINVIQMNKSTKKYRTRSTTNEVMVNIQGLFDVELSDKNFTKHADIQLTRVAKRLVRVEKEVNSQSEHLNSIQKGELLLVWLRDEEAEADKFLLSKVEVISMLKTDDVSIARGIIKEVKHLWKSCLFSLEEVQEDEGGNYFVADVYSNTNSTYWHHRFLELDEITNDVINTKRSFHAIDKLLEKEVKKYFPYDHMVLRNAFVQYYRRGGDLDYNNMISEVFGSYSPEHHLFTDEVKDGILKKLKDLPTKKNGEFDTFFKSIYAELNVKIKKVLPLRTGLNLVITDAINDFKDVIRAYEDPDQGRQLVITVEDKNTFELFKHKIELNDD